MSRAVTAYRAGAAAIIVLTLGDFVLVAGARFHDLSSAGRAVSRDALTNNGFDGVHWLAGQALTPLLAVALVVVGAVAGMRVLLIRAAVVLALAVLDVVLWSMAPTHAAFGAVAGLASVGVLAAAVWARSAPAVSQAGVAPVAHAAAR